MSDTVALALITSVANILAIIVSRLLSRHEHKQTSVAIDEIRTAVNGKAS